MQSDMQSEDEQLASALTFLYEKFSLYVPEDFDVLCSKDTDVKLYQVILISQQLKMLTVKSLQHVIELAREEEHTEYEKYVQPFSIYQRTITIFKSNAQEQKIGLLNSILTGLPYEEFIRQCNLINEARTLDVGFLLNLRQLCLDEVSESFLARPTLERNPGSGASAAGAAKAKGKGKAKPYEGGMGGVEYKAQDGRDVLGRGDDTQLWGLRLSSEELQQQRAAFASMNRSGKSSILGVGSSSGESGAGSSADVFFAGSSMMTPLENAKQWYYEFLQKNMPEDIFNREWRTYMSAFEKIATLLHQENCLNKDARLTFEKIELHKLQDFATIFKDNFYDYLHNIEMPFKLSFFYKQIQSVYFLQDSDEIQQTFALGDPSADPNAASSTVSSPVLFQLPRESAGRNTRSFERDVEMVPINPAGPANPNQGC